MGLKLEGVRSQTLCAFRYITDKQQKS